MIVEYFDTHWLFIVLEDARQLSVRCCFRLFQNISELFYIKSPQVDLEDAENIPEH
jgi:hypothetical protein